MPFIIGLITKGVSTGIGLVGEKYADRQERKAALAEKEKAGAEQLVNPLEPGAETADDERIWALDETAGGPPSYEASELANFPPGYEASETQQRPPVDRTISDLVREVVAVQHAESPEHHEIPNRLPYPIIIPQRRPGTKARGFAHAYPPDLEAYGIDQNAFMQFFKNFEDASQASPWLRTVYVSAGAVGFIPGHITLAVSLSVQIAAGTAIEFQTRYRANAFLDQINRDLFMPLGLYCMVLMSKDGSGTAQNPEFGMENVNIDTAKKISRWGLPKEHQDDDQNLSKKDQILRPIRLVSGRTNANDMPLEIAPLVYPGLDDLAERPEIKRDENFKARIMRNKDFVADYFDRRARADYAGNNPDSALTKAGADVPEFKNRFADPNHPANNGHLLSLVTGGKIVAQPLGRRRGNRLRAVGPDGKLLPKEKQERPVYGPVGLITKGVKKVLTPNVLYLTIVNMPSEAELAEARQALGFDKKGLADMMQGLKTE